MVKPSHKTIRTTAKKFWSYMKDNGQLLETRSELRHLYTRSFLPTLSNNLEKAVPFSAVLWYFRSTLKIIEWKPVNDRENIVYRKGKTVAVDQSYLLNRERKKTEEIPGEILDGFTITKKRLVEQRHRLQLTKDKCGVSILPEPDENGIVHMDTTSKILQLTVTNQVDTDVTLQCTVLGSSGPFTVDNLIHNIVSESKSAMLSGNGRIDFTVSLSSANPGVYSMPVAFMFYRDGEAPFHIVKYIRAEISDDVVARLQPKVPYIRPKPVAIVYEPDVETERGEPPCLEKPNYVKRLGKYSIPENLRHQMNIGQLQAVFETFEDGGNYTAGSYCAKFSKLLHVEELQMEVDMAKYRMEKAKLKKPKAKKSNQGGNQSGNQRFLTLEVPGLAEKRPSLVRGDRLFVKKLAADGTPENKRYEGYIHRVELNEVFLRFSVQFHKNFISNSSYEVEFKFSRSTLQVMHRAVEHAVPYLGTIPFDGRLPDDDDNMLVARLNRCFDQKIEQNVEQRQAVKNILEKTSKPYPYIVFGPPGTGKTVTIVEAIKQVLHGYPNSRILACAPSNSAADLILERVAEYNIIPKEQMVRLNAFGRCETTVNEKIREYCIPDGEGYFFLPTKEHIENSYRFVVTTLMTAGRLESLGIQKTHFDYIFIDEAGQSMEPECLVPIVGLLSIDGDNPGQLVLAGDAKQLGPILRSPIAIKYGLAKSFLERLMGPNYNCYNRVKLNNQYDPKMVTKLLNNYRSHPAIIKLPNEMFYDNELRACADEALRNCLCHWSDLKKKGFPVIFEAVCGKDQREEKSPSFFNPEEVSVVLRYVESLKDARGLPLKTSEIGIISPYHRQVQKIRQELQKKPLKVHNIKVGSVEEFQGQERKVIIISTVRSNEEFLQLDAQHRLGFLKNPKRFNVAITRAKALLIVIGNPNVLCHDLHWRGFIQYCVDNGSFFGGSGSSGSLFKMPEEADKTLVETLQRLSLNENTLFEDESDLTGADYENRPWRSDEQ